MNGSTINLIIVFVWLLSIVYCLLKLRATADTTARAIWALLIVVIPFIGALAFLLVESRKPA